MQILKVVILSFLFLSSLIGKEQADSKTVYIYNKDMEGVISKTTWTVEEKNNTFHIQGKSIRGETRLITSPPLNTQSFSYQTKNKQDEYYIYREGPHLYAKRIDETGIKQKKFHIGNRFWLQEFDFSMRSFITSPADSLKFSIIHPKNLSLHRMIATKFHSLDQIQIQDKVYQAIKVKITLRGFKKMFWKAELWFDHQSGDLLKYRANEGPNTPISVITLLSKASVK